MAEVNHYEVKIIANDEETFLKPNCTKHSVPNEGDEIQTAIHCSLQFQEDVTFREPTFSFKIQLKDTTLKNKNAENTAQLPVTLVFSGSPQSLTMLRLYPKSVVKIFKTAAPLARVTQPIDIRNCTDFKMTESMQMMTGVEKNPKKGQIFNVTNEGIIFIHDFIMLRKISSEFVSINVSWSRNNRKEHDEIQVRIVIEPNQTCNNIKSLRGWTSCAEYETSHDCLQRDSCAYGTGGSSSVEFRRGPERCMWRGDVTSPTITHVYSTCSPDIHTCPDGVCDSLEQLHYAICPQDCTANVVVPLKINPATGRGVDESSGTVACSPTNCYSMKSRKGYDKDKKDLKKKKGKSSGMSSTPANNIFAHSNITKENGNITTGKYSLVIGKCGSICIMGIGAGALFLAAAIAFIVVCWRLDKTSKAVRKNNDGNNQEMTAPLSISAPGNVPHEPFSLNFNMTTLMNDSLIFNNIMKFSPDPKWEFPRSQLAIEQILGEGEFGRVLRAKALNISGPTGYTTVAVKTLKEDARESELNDLLSEYQLLKEVSHPNVIRLLGVCTEPGGPIYLIIEYCEYGSLRNHLRKSRRLQYESKKLINTEENDYDEPKTSDITPKDLISFAWQICNGMSYLSDIKLVHRDLAARNVLLAADKICKVSDFGLTRDVYEDNAYLKRSKGRVPVKWMAPESLADHIYTSKSDVWSFGILVWELITLGSTPYPGIVVQNLYHLLRQGYRMERPNNCSPALYNIMRKCWSLNPQQRPTFQELSKRFEKLLEDNIEYINLSDNVIHNRGYFLSPFAEDDLQENMEEELSSEISSLNYLSRTESCEKFVAIEKALHEELEKITDVAQTTQSYETPVKVPRRVKTPSNENPEEYTDMGRKS
ncbi:unnamed protein product [Phaedon cochleariae]|uniref:Protein kinase domain-containing protein n=1 Tax=Phaedon cochleariae TaxID=80249 RepID=A0A9P0GN64_PHACE|nr:unnamed protein product [Phaedon cochleariae]